MICREIPFLPPVEVAERLIDWSGFAFLDSADTGGHGEVGRFAFIGTDPFAEFVIRKGQAFWNGQMLPGAPLPHLRDCLARYRTSPDPAAPPLRSGCIGHIAYDFGQHLEKLSRPDPADPSVTDLRFGFYDVIHAFDLRERRAWIFSSGFPEDNTKARGNRAEDRLEHALARLSATPTCVRADAVPVTDWSSNFTDESYAIAVGSVIDHIREGDIYQANISQRFEAMLPPGFDPWAFYRNLRAANPAPFAAYLADGENVIASSSPERFLSLRDGLVEARPIKGTAIRSADPVEDRALAEALMASEKDRAENVMIVDLLRNDISRVCEHGSVKVPKLCALESYASVHHLTSVVQGRLRTDCDALDLIAASFPGGSVTGAPKLRAMNIITALERKARGVYCGAIGYIDFDGSMDFSIAIRTVVLGGNRAVLQAGGGVTLLSDGAAEYAETLVKAQRLFAAFAHAPIPEKPVDAAHH